MRKLFGTEESAARRASRRSTPRRSRAWARRSRPRSGTRIPRWSSGATRASPPAASSGRSTGGLAKAGGLVRFAGVVPTPAVAWLTRELGADAGVVVSASHNPWPDNGVKIFSRRGPQAPRRGRARDRAPHRGGGTGAARARGRRARPRPRLRRASRLDAPPPARRPQGRHRRRERRRVRGGAGGVRGRGRDGRRAVRLARRPEHQRGLRRAASRGDARGRPRRGRRPRDRARRRRGPDHRGGRCGHAPGRRRRPLPVGARDGARGQAPRSRSSGPSCRTGASRRP